MARLIFRGQPQAVPHVIGDGLGISCCEQNRAIFWKHFRSTSSASNASGVSVRSRAQATADMPLYVTGEVSWQQAGRSLMSTLYTAHLSIASRRRSP